MRKQTNNLFNFALIIFCKIILISCTPPPTSVSQSNNNIQDIRVQVVEPERTTSKVEQFPLPNCGGTDKLAQSLGTFASISKSATVGAKAIVTGGGEVQIPEAVKLKLEIQVELAYQNTFESANSRIDSIEMSALAGTHVVYTILWENQTFTSIVQYSTDGKVYEVPYTYQLSVPKIDTSYQVVCSDSDNVESPGHESLEIESNISIDPTVYDNFDGSTIGSAFDENLWKYWDDTSTNGFTQENGLLKFVGEESTALVARQHINLYLRTPVFDEANLMLSSTEGGSVTLKIHGDLPNNSYWATQCGIYAPAANAPAWAFCDYGRKGDAQPTYTDGKDTNLNIWHRFRLEVNPAQQTVTYYIDGESVGNIIVTDIETAQFSLVLGTFSSSGTISAFIDDVKYGSIE